MKHVTSIEGMKVEIYTEGYDLHSAMPSIKTILTTPNGRWINHSIVSRGFIKHKIFKEYIAEQVLESYKQRDKDNT